MRYATVVLYLDEETFHPVAYRLMSEPSLTRQAIHSIKLLDDETIVLFGELTGDIDRYREILDDSPECITCTVASGDGDGPSYVYSQIRATEQTRKLLERRDNGDIIIKMPMEYTGDGGLKFTIVGKEESLLELSTLFDVEGSQMELVATGPYSPDSDGVFGDLTDRQQEVLETALGMGYYENPRGATLEEIAAELDIDHGTVGRHIRAIESKVFSKYIR